jgi:LAS superfamily LD-carboxypeptidase LdcB
MNTHTTWTARALIGIVALVIIGLGGYEYYVTYSALKDTRLALASTTASYTTTLKIQDDTLAATQAKNTQLEAELGQQVQQNDAYGAQVGQLSTTVGTLAKLAATDPELLEKYSKVFFLNENYTPAKLSNIDTSYVYGTKSLQFQSDALPFLNAMIDAARASGTNLSVISAYRSFGTQAMLKSSYKVTYGKGSANSFSADQGYSEHQLGTAVDLTTSTVKDSFAGFEKTTAYTWLTNNAYQYGFILSYPSGNAYYVYEPWHWRFVGVKLATMLHAEHENFYDLDQRAINLYLVALFDPIKSTTTGN